MLVVAVVLSVVVVALAKYVTADLEYSRVAEARAERQASATSAITYGVERVRLGQTLCAAPAGGIGPITAGILDRNGTTTTLTCSRFSTGTSDITGWAVVITGNGITSDLLQVQGGGIKRVTGPMFINTVEEIDIQGVGPELRHIDGDLWYHRSTCPGGAVTMPSTYVFQPADARGPLCTQSTWNQIVSQPVVPTLSSLPPNVNGATFTMVGTCRVYAPAHFTGAIDLGSDDVYFQSGNYWFDGVGTVEVKQQAVWFGSPGSTTAVIANPDCAAARTADPTTGGTGAVAYMGGNSKLLIRNQGSIEFFDKSVGDYQLSVQELESDSGYAASTMTAATGQSIIEVTGGTTADGVFHGMVYTPNSEFRFDNSSNSATQQLLGGAAVARMSVQASSSATGFKIAVATTPTLAKIVMIAESATPDGATTSVQAIVDYRPDEIVMANRVAINSLRVLD